MVQLANTAISPDSISAEVMLKMLPNGLYPPGLPCPLLLEHFRQMDSETSQKHLS